MPGVCWDVAGEWNQGPAGDAGLVLGPDKAQVPPEPSPALPRAPCSSLDTSALQCSRF